MPLALVAVALAALLGLAGVALVVVGKVRVARRLRAGGWAAQAWYLERRGSLAGPLELGPPSSPG